MFVAMFIAKSQAMVGDSSAMVIDSLTYLFNSYAERIKNISLQEGDDSTISESEKELRRLERTRQRLWLEILPPSVSVVTLIGLTIYILMDAFHTLVESFDEVGVVFNSAEDSSLQSSSVNEPDIGVMFFFSTLNLALDILNVTCFARAKHTFGFAVIDKDRHRYMLAYDGSLHNQYADSLRVRSEIDLSRFDGEDRPNCINVENYSSITEGNKENSPFQIDKGTKKIREVNLNMCSAYTVSEILVPFNPVFDWGNFDSFLIQFCLNASSLFDLTYAKFSMYLLTPFVAQPC